MKRLKQRTHDNQSSMRAIFFAILTLMLMFSSFHITLAPVQPVLAADDSDNNSDTYPHITELENTILGQNFPGQPVAERLSRMEKKAFGKVSTKPDLSDRTDDLDDYADKQLHKKLRPDADEEVSREDKPIQDQADYPHVTALEQAILGQTFAEQSLANRLSRMEVRAFGKVSTSTDSSDRTDALDDYTYKQLHKNLLQANTNIEGINSSEDEPIQNQADYPHVTALEQAILGQTFAGQPLADRLSRMEIKAFGSASTNPDLGERTDALDKYAQKKLHKQTLNNGDSDTVDNPQQSGLLSKVEHAIVGMAGGGIMGGGGPGMGGMGFGGPGMGFGGMGFPGMGNGFSGVGSGGGAMRRRQAAQQQQPEPAAPTHQDDPAVYQAAPPDPNARLIVKVGWCEVKIFGHTFPSMHLPERLGQINKELNLEPGKSDIQLMDDIGIMIKAVQARKPSAPINQPSK